MTWTILYTASAAKCIRKLDPQIRRRVRSAVETLAEDPERGRPLQMSLNGLRSWRTGDYRIVYRLKESEIEILVVAVGHRGDVYERIRRNL